MTNYREHFKQLLPVIQAWTEGKTIQFNLANRGWRDFMSMGYAAPGWYNSDTEWRIKPEKKVGYMNVYGAYLHATREEAATAKGVGRIACIRVEYEEGQYDD